MPITYVWRGSPTSGVRVILYTLLAVRDTAHLRRRASEGVLTQPVSTGNLIGCCVQARVLTARPAMVGCNVGYPVRSHQHRVRSQQRKLVNDRVYVQPQAWRHHQVLARHRRRRRRPRTAGGHGCHAAAWQAQADLRAACGRRGLRRHRQRVQDLADRQQADRQAGPPALRPAGWSEVGAATASCSTATRARPSSSPSGACCRRTS